MMRILFAADIHVHPEHLDQLIQAAHMREADALIIGGDIVPHRLPGYGGMGILEAHAEYVASILIPGIKRLKALRDIEIFLDFSNDDFIRTRSLLVPYHGQLLHLLHMEKHPIAGGVDVVGYMMVPPTPFKRKDWEKPDTTEIPCPTADGVRLDGYTSCNGRLEETVLDLHGGETIEADLNRLSERIERPFIFVSHCPPFGTALDMLGSGDHAGSISVLRFIQKWSRRRMLIASLHGHIHESPTISNSIFTQINNTLSINPGQAHELQYALLELSHDQKRAKVRLLPS